MSRQIRYRAWIGSENTNFIDMPMHYEYEVECIYEGKYATVENGWDIQGVYENVPLEQDTGLKDKNNKSIWEGDIVAEHNGDIIGKIIQHPSGEWQIAWIGVYGGGSKLHDHQGLCEVIGSYRENPELLEKK